MGDKIVVGPINKGLRTDRTAFVIDNDNFPVLTNAYQWRGRVKRKRGTRLLNRLSRYFDSTSIAYSSTSTITLGDDGHGNGTGNLLTGFTTLESDASLKLGSISITDTTASVTYTDDSMGNLNGNPSGSGTVNYATGDIVIDSSAGDSITAHFIYYPTLPVMGLEDFISPSLVYPGTLAFDTVYSYNITTSYPYSIYNVSYYKNPPTAGGYTHKSVVTPTSWNGEDYQQFYTVNYQGALWATNGIDVPFTTTNIGMQFAPASTITVSSQTATTLVVVITNCPLIIGDFVFVNEFTAGTPSNATTLNFQTGYVTACSPDTPPLATKTLTITFPNANIATDTYSPGIIQYLTNRSDTTIDCLRWYDGDPTNGSASAPVLNGNLGWVNFAPPLSQFNYSIAELPLAQYYLVGARLIVPFKDRLLFFGPVVQTSSPNSQIYLQDTVIYSQNGTPYYTCSFQGEPELADTVFTPLLVPKNQTATAPAYWEDQTGFGGYITAGLDLPILTVSPNQDVLIVGFYGSFQTKIVYSGNDIVPFNFYIINSELGSGSTFSTVNMDQGVLTRGTRGFVITNQTSAQRFDLDIPDSAFELNLLNNGAERFCAQRDFLSEWVYFTYPSNMWNNKFPNQTLQYNYRDVSWAIFNECYTTYGSFRRQSGFTWATVGMTYPTWGVWNVPWNSSESTLLNPEVIAGNQQGFVIFRDVGTTSEATSLNIDDITSNTITSVNHCLNAGDYITISGVLGSIGSDVNGQVFSVGVPITANTFTINPTVPSGTYLGGGLITRMYVPFIQTKQFPVAWELARKTRLGPQQYLLTKTANSQITLLIYLSQSGETPFNAGPIVPAPGSFNNSLIYSTILYTCPESANLGLTPANTNLQILSEINAAGDNASSPQQQIWHRVNTSLIGDTVQVGFTLSDSQMRDPNLTFQFAEIELHSIILDCSPSSVLA
jgi:hypothetical protein